MRSFILVFYYDILIYSSCEEEHLKRLELTLELLKRHKLFAKRLKYQFGCREIGYLGHLFLGKGVQTELKKLKAMKECPRPRTLKALRRFLGLTGYYKRFIKNYGSIAVGLTALLKKNYFKWDEEAEKASNSLKRAISQPPILSLPDFSKSFCIKCDASGKGVLQFSCNRVGQFLF